MSTAKKKFYVVWEGTRPGVYSTWSECESAIKGFSNARYKAFPSAESAAQAFQEGPTAYWGTDMYVSPLSAAELAIIGMPIPESICVDAAWNPTTKRMEYQGVWLTDRSIAFHQGPFENGTNNIGEFLAIVHAQALLTKMSLNYPIYSDSKTAISWVQDKEVRSESMEKNETSARINSLVQRALTWLTTNECKSPILKWETQAWGENPADFGRK